MFHHKVVALQKLNQTIVPKIQLLLGMEVAQSFVIRVDNKFSRQQVMALMPKSLNDGIKLFVIYGVLLLSIIQLFIELSNWVVLLTKYSPYTIPEASHSTSKGLVKSGRGMTSASVIFCFTLLKALAAALFQTNSPCFKQSVMGT